MLECISCFYEKLIIKFKYAFASGEFKSISIGSVSLTRLLISDVFIAMGFKTDEIFPSKELKIKDNE